MDFYHKPFCYKYKSFNLPCIQHNQPGERNSTCRSEKEGYYEKEDIIMYYVKEGFNGKERGNML